jgi:hypothetical protein
MESSEFVLLGEEVRKGEVGERTCIPLASHPLGELFLTRASPSSTRDKSSLTPILPLASPHITSSPALTILLFFVITIKY